MRLVSHLRYALIPVLALATLVTAMPKALAGSPYLDKGGQPDLTNFYDKVQSVEGSIFENRAIYGKLEGDTPIDVYSFTADRDGEQSLSLLVRKDEVKSSSDPYLVFIDPTQNTEAQELGIPVPSDSYHTAIVKQIALSDPQNFSEPALMEKYVVAADQRIAFTKGKVYYAIVLDSDRGGSHFTHYAIRFGDGKSWTAGDIFKHFGAWVKVKVDSYGGVSPFHFGPAAVGLFLLLLGLIGMVGAWIIQSVIALLSNRSKAAAYLLVKLQPFSTVSIWIGLWFVVLGGYMYFARASWSGLPFILAVLFLPILAVMLVDTLVLSPQIKQVEVSRKEADIPLPIRKKLFVTFVLNTIFLVTFTVLLTMHLVG